MGPEPLRPLPRLRNAFSVLLVLGLIARILGVAREIIVAGLFGAGSALDAVYLGLSVPLAISVGIGSGLNRATIPVAVGLEKDRLAGLVRTAIWRFSIILLVLSLAIAGTAGFWTEWLSPTGEDPLDHLILYSALFGSLAICAVGPAGVLGGTVNALGHHTAAAMVPLVYNIVVCTVIIIGHGSLGVLALPAGIMLAEFTQIAIYYPIVRRATSGHHARALEEDLMALAEKFWPAAFIGVALGLNVVVDRFFATFLDEGSIAALVYADRLVNLPAGLLGMAIAVPLYTRLSHWRNQGNNKAFRADLIKGSRFLTVAGLSVATVVYWTSVPAVGLLLERGAFEEQAVSMTATALVAYAVGIPFLAVGLLLSNAVLTIRRQTPLVVIMLGTIALNALLDWVLMWTFGLFGIAVSTSLVALVRVALFLVILLGGRDLWAALLLPVMVGAVASAGIATALWLIMPLVPSTGLGIQADRCAEIILAAGVFALIMLVYWFAGLHRYLAAPP